MNLQMSRFTPIFFLDCFGFYGVEIKKKKEIVFGIYPGVSSIVQFILLYLACVTGLVSWCPPAALCCAPLGTMAFIINRKKYLYWYIRGNHRYGLSQ